MRYYYLCLCFCLLLSAPANAQFSRSIAEMKRDRKLEHQLLLSQPLLVMLKREDPKELKKLAGNSAELQAYKEYIAFVNNVMQLRVRQIWTLSPSIEYKYEDEIEALVASNTGQLNVLEYDRFSFSTSVPDRKGTPGLGSTKLSAFRLQLFVKKVPFVLHTEPILSKTLNESDIVYALKMVEAMAKNNKPTMVKLAEKPKTLLLCQEERAADLTDAQIQQVYPHPYRFVSRAEFEKAMQETPTEYAFVRNSWMGYGEVALTSFTLPNLEFLAMGKPHSWNKEQGITLKDFKNLKEGLLR